MPAAAAVSSGMRCLSTSERAVSGAKASVPRGAVGSGTAPTVTLKAWDPKMPYIDALKAAAKGEAYKVARVLPRLRGMVLQGRRREVRGAHPHKPRGVQA